MRRSAFVGVLAAAVLLGACGTDATTSTSSIQDTSQSTTPASSNPESVGIDDFTSPVVGGGSFVLSKALTAKPVVLWFWAPG
jgi:major membrane immunogen (membrane-anchored lipoprotein)